MMNKRNRESDFSHIVYVFDEQCLGQIISYGAYASKIKYAKNGIEYIVDLLNEEFEVINEPGIHYIEEDL